MYDVANAKTLQPYFDSRAGLVLPYHDLDGKPMRGHPKWPEFYRLRYTGAPSSFSDAGGDKPKRYVQPADTGVCAYFPSVVDWRAIAKDATQGIFITEGELKAACATVNGLPTVGLGGVYSFRSASNGIFFLPELEEFNWARRRVYIVYDSDYQKNPKICAAINALSEELQERGALISVITLESVYDDEDKKTGLDDYIVERGLDAITKLMELAEPLAMTRKLWAMNEEVLYVANPGFIVALPKGDKIPVANFTGHSDWATASVPERKMTPTGAISTIKTSAATVWIKWPLRNRVDKLAYLPGEEQFCIDSDNSYVFNAWPGWGAEPKKGSIEPFHKLFNFVFEGLTKEEKEWLLDWMAYPIKYPGSKLFQAVIVHGRMTGTGKTFIGYTLGRIYGKNFTKIKNESLQETWWAENKQFILGDEISGSDKRSDMDLMKTMITQEEMDINIKFIPQYTIKDCVNYYLTSQHADALWLEDEDRRFFVHEVIADAPLPHSFYKEYERWLNNGGAGALMHWLQERKIGAGFDPKGPAPRTAARQRMVRLGKTDLDGWCADLKNNANHILRVGHLRHVRDLFTSKELLNMFLAENDTGNSKLTPSGMARALAKAGYKQAYDGQPIPLKSGGSGRYFMIRNAGKWSKAKSGELAKHIALEPIRD